MLAPNSLPPKVAKALRTTEQRANSVRMMRALWPVLMAASVVALLGPLLGYLGPVTSSLVGAVVLASLGWLTWRSWTRFEPETEAQSQQRLEAFHGVQEFAPLTGRYDRPISGDTALWQWQANRAFALLPTLSKPAPWPVTKRDGVGLLALLVVAGLASLSPSQALNGFRFDLSPLMGDGPISVAVTATPPDYTGLPAIVVGQAGEVLRVPEGTTLSVRVDGPRGAPKLSLPGPDTRLERQADGSWAGSVIVTKSGALTIDRWGSRGRWPLQVTADKAPELTGEVTIEPASQGRVQVRFTAGDDYGLTAAGLELTPVEAIASLPSSAIPTVALTLPKQRETETQTTEGAPQAFALTAEVRRHVLAGLPVEARLVVTDGAGQAVRSKPVKLALPELEPRNALAAAMLDARSNILRDARPYQIARETPVDLIDPTSGAKIALDLSDPLAGAPAGIALGARKLQALYDASDLLSMDPIGVAGVRLALSILSSARSVAQAHDVEAELWALALRFNGSAGTPAQQAIADARDALRDAIESGASPGEIEERMDDLRAAISQRLQELAQEQGAQSQDMAIEQPGGESLSAQDLADMLDQLEDSGAGGDAGSALEQLAELDQLLQNLQAGGQSGGGIGGGSSAGEGGQSGEGQAGEGAGQADPLTQALREQERLADQTLQQQAGPGQGTEPGDNGEIGDGSGGGGDQVRNLAQAQRALGERLEDLADQGQGGDGAEGAQGAAQAAQSQAAQAMGRAADALDRNDLSGARQAQREAVSALRNARRLAAQDRRRNGQAGQEGQGDQDGRNAQNRDPLGRLIDGLNGGSDTEVPDQIERRQARDIRDLLRRRQAEPDRSDDERGYLDRLLDGF